MCSLGAGGEGHHGDDDLVLESGLDDALARPNQVVDIVEGIEVANGGHAVFLEHLGMEFDDLAGGGVEGDDVDAAGEGLEVGIGATGLAEAIHQLVGVVVEVEDGGLEHGAAAGLEPGDAGVAGGFDGGEEIIGEDARAEYGLEAVAEGGAHELDLFLGHSGLCFMGILQYHCNALFYLYVNSVRFVYRRQNLCT